MRKRKLRALKKLPFVPSIKKIERLDDELAKIVINTKTIRKAKVTLCWGQKTHKQIKNLGVTVKIIKRGGDSNFCYRVPCGYQ